ncbi:MAG: InlB B-repeat-containing protein [Bacilli bacterium]|nr:InlB B-repeat-containing protein [Bacilli bacterium]
MKRFPNIKNLHIDDAKEVLNKNNIKIKSIKKKISFGIRKDYVIKTEPEEISEDNKKITIFISKLRVLPIVLFFILGILGILSIRAYFLFKAPKIDQKDKDNFSQSSEVEVIEDAEFPGDELDYYLYCVSETNDINTCEWKRTDTKNIEIGKSGIWYVWFKGVSKSGKESKPSEVEIVKIDNDAPVVTNIKTKTTTNSIDVTVEAYDALSESIKYYYSISNQRYVESDDNYLFENLKSNTWYSLKIKVVDSVNNEYVIELRVKTLEEDKKDDDKEETNDEQIKENDLKAPIINLDEVSSVFTLGTESKLPSYVEYDEQSGNTTCEDELNNKIEDTSELTAGEHTITCVAKGNNGLSSTVKKDVVVELPAGKDLEFDGWVKLNLYYPSNSVERKWRTSSTEYARTGDGTTEWQSYTGPVLVRMDKTDSIYISYVINNKKYVVAPKAKLAVDIEPEEFEVYNGETTKVSINYDDRATTKQYRINGGEWQDYVGEFEVGPHTLIDARATAQEGVYDNSGYLITYKTISNDDSVMIKQKWLQDTTISSDDTNNSVLVYTSTSSGPVITYITSSGETIDIVNPANTSSPVITTGAGYSVPSVIKTSLDDSTGTTVTITDCNGNTVYDLSDLPLGQCPITITSPSLPTTTSTLTTTTPQVSYAINGPSISSSVSTRTTSSTITLTAEYEARAIYYSIDGGLTYKKYNEPFEVRENIPIYAYYIRESDGKESKKSYTRIYNISNGPVLKITFNPDHLDDEYLTSTTATITGSYYTGDIYYSYDGVIYEKYTSPLTITESKTLYAKATDDNNITTVVSEKVALNVTPYIPVEREVKINVSPKEPTDDSLVNEVKATIYYEEGLTKRYYRLNYASEWSEYTGEITIKENTVIQAYGTNDAGDKGSDTVRVDYLYKGMSAPVIKVEPSKSLSSEIKITINYDRNAVSKKYTIDGVTYDYEGPFTLYENVTIKATEADLFGDEKEATYTVSNYKPAPTIEILDKGTYFIVNLNYPSSAKTKEYKWLSDGDWKSYPSSGIVFVLPEANYNSEADYFEIEDKEGNTVRVSKDHIYNLTTLSSDIFENLFIRWDFKKLDTPDFIILDEEPCRSTKIFINFDLESVGKEYKIVYPNGEETDWQVYSGGIDVDMNNTKILARSISEQEDYSDTGYYTVTNIDDENPVIEVEPSTTRPAKKVYVSVMVTDNGVIDYVSFNGNPVDSPNFVTTVEENGVYTIYARDSVGNETTKDIIINNIDNEAPDIEINNLTSDLITNKVEIEINYEENSTNQLYSLDNSNWQAYNGKFELTSLQVASYFTNGTITIYARATDEAGNTGTVDKIIYNLDSEIPDEPVINAVSMYPTLTENELRKYSIASIDYDLNYDMDNLYCTENCDDDSNWKKYTGSFKFDGARTTVYAKSIKKDSKLEISSSSDIDILSDELSSNAYDNNEETYVSADINKIGLNVDTDKYMLYVLHESSSNTKVCFYDKNNEQITCDQREGTQRYSRYYIPSDTQYVTFTGNIYEIYLTERPTLISEPIISINREGKWDTSKTVDITYPSNNYTNEYSIDNGLTWNTYANPFVVDDDILVIARSTNNGEYVSSSSYYINYIDNTVPTISIDNDHITVIDTLSLTTTYNENKGANISCTVDGKSFDLNSTLSAGTHNAVCTIITNANVSASDTKTVYVQDWSTIMLHTNGGSLDVDRVSKFEGKAIGDLPVPEKGIYSFSGWYSDENLTNKVTSSTILTSDITDLYAKWEIKAVLSNFDEYIYLDATNGNDSTGDGTIASPYKTLSALSSVVTTGKSYGIVLSDGTYSLPESVFTLNNDKSINLIGNREKTILSVSTLFANSHGGSTNYTVGFYRLVWNGTSNASNTIFVANKLEFNNVAFKLNFTSANYSYFISGTKGYSFTNCSLTPYVSGLIRCSANGIKLTNSYGGYSSGWNTTDSYWNYQTNYITTSPNMDSKYNILDDESVWKGVGTGTNPDGTTANIGVYGGTYSWEFKDDIFD